MTPRRASRAVLLVASVLAAGGCSTVGNGHLVALDRAEAQTLLVPGKTTRADVRRALGEGAAIHFESGMETWHYAYREGLAAGWDEVPFVNLVAARLDRPTKELVLLFDATGVLRRWSLQTYRRREPPPGSS